MRNDYWCIHTISFLIMRIFICISFLIICIPCNSYHFHSSIFCAFHSSHTIISHSFLCQRPVLCIHMYFIPRSMLVYISCQFHSSQFMCNSFFLDNRTSFIPLPTCIHVYFVPYSMHGYNSCQFDSYIFMCNSFFIHNRISFIPLSTMHKFTPLNSDVFHSSQYAHPKFISISFLTIRM